MKYPNIEVKLTGTDENAFAVLGKVQKAMKENNVHQNEINKFLEEATAGDYDSLLRTCCAWVNVS